MNPQTNQPGTPAQPPKKKRRGVVIVAVLIVVAALSLAGYHYLDLMVAEQKASEYAHRNVQARAFAESGIHWTAAKLADPDAYMNELGSNPWNNEIFLGRPVLTNGTQGYFSIIAPASGEEGSDVLAPRPGVSDEGGKINPNASMKRDPTGQELLDMLMKLPSPMTEEVAKNIVAWMGGSAGIEGGGAQAQAYQPARTKGGPLDSIDELLLVQGVTRELLYGTDLNRNGFQDPDEPGAFDHGISAYLTVHSREQNCDQYGKPFVYINNEDVAGLYAALAEKNIPDEISKYIIMYRQYGPSGASGSSQSLGSALAAALGLKPASSSGNSSTVPGDLASYQIKMTKPATRQLKSLFDLVGTAVTISKVDPANPKKTIKVVYNSPISDPATMSEKLLQLYEATTFHDTAEITPRINLITAPEAVLATLPGLTQVEVKNLISARKQLVDAGDMNALRSPAWLLTEAKLPITALTELGPLITTRTQVYRVQSVGYFDGKGPACRLEAVIDTNAGRPRILAWRDLSELGKGWNATPAK